MSVNQENPNPQPSAGDDLPDWLREIRGDVKPKAPEPPKVSPVEPPQPDLIEDALPDWLSDVSTEESASAEPAEDAGEELWRQILAEEGVSLEDLPEDRPEGAEGLSVKDYMAATADESAKRQAKSQLISPAQPAKPEAKPEAETKPAAPVSPVDDGQELWRQILAEEGLSLEDLPEDRPEGAEGLSVKDYMVATADESAKRQAKAQLTPPPTPAKKAEPEPAMEIEEAEEAEDDGMVIEDELPDWLREEQPAQGPMPAFSWMSDESTMEEEPEFAEAQVAEPEDDGLVIEDELPDWLREEQPAQGPMPAFSWMSDESTMEEEPEFAEAQVAEPEDDGLVIEDELPDWLREEQPAQGPMPAFSWMSDESTIEEEPEFAEAQVAEPEDDGLVVEDELPDWLREDHVSMESVPSFSWLSDESSLEETVEPLADEEEILLPTGTASFDEDEFIDSEGLPDWLREDQPVQEKEVPAVDHLVASPVAEASAAEVEDDGLVDMDSLPDWLRGAGEFERAGAEEAAPSWLAETLGDGEPAVEAVEAEETAVPQWLQAATTESALMVDDEAELSEQREAANIPAWLMASSVEEEPIEVNEAPAEHLGVPSWLERLRHEEVLEPEEIAEPEVVAPAPAARVAPAEPPRNRLAMARAALQAGNLEEAVPVFQSLIEESFQLEQVIASLNAGLKARPNEVTLYEILGDAQMRSGQLNQALQSYKKALEVL